MQHFWKALHSVKFLPKKGRREDSNDVTLKHKHVYNYYWYNLNARLSNEFFRACQGDSIMLMSTPIILLNFPIIFRSGRHNKIAPELLHFAWYHHITKPSQNSVSKVTANNKCQNFRPTSNICQNKKIWWSIIIITMNYADVASLYCCKRIVAQLWFPGKLIKKN